MIPEHRIDQLLTIELDRVDGTVLDLSSGYTPLVEIVHADAPNDLVTTSTSVTLGATSPNYVIALNATALSGIISAWGGTHGEYGEVFRFDPLLVRTSDSAKIPWPGRRLEWRLLPAPT